MTSPSASSLLRQSIKLFFIIFLISSSLLSGLLTLFYQNESQEYLEYIKLQEIHSLELQKKQISSIFRELFADILLFRDQNELHRYLENNDSFHLQEIESEYKALSNHSGLYDQIRYLDSHGQEIVRVDYKYGQAIPITHENLQNKAKRYYFADCFRLDKDQIFISPFDLNIEHGKVEEPLKPMIRLCTPVFNKHKQKRGVILFNYLGKHLFNAILSSEKTSIGETMLVNKEGYWLQHVDPDKEWGFMFEHKQAVSFAVEYPQIWQKIQEEKEGQIYSEFGLFTFSLVYPLQQNGLLLNNTQDLLDEYQWVLVSFVAEDNLQHLIHTVLAQFFVLGASTFLVAALGSWFFAYVVSKRKVMQNQLKAMAYFDSLTSLPNRRHFFDRLEETIAHCKRYNKGFAILYIDLDGFKNINDSFGHEAGDSLLVHVAACLREVCRKSDIIARLGGDELGVLVPANPSQKAAAAIAAKIIAVLGLPAKLNGGEGKIGASIGIALYPDDSADGESLVNKADSAMYLAKSQGKNNYLFYSDTIPDRNK